VFNPWNEDGRRGKRSADAMRSSGQRLHGGQVRGGARRWQKLVVGALPCFSVEGGRRGQVGRVGRRGQFGQLAARPAGPKSEENFFSE
jgi:hypothetical protein